MFELRDQISKLRLNTFIEVVNMATTSGIGKVVESCQVIISAVPKYPNSSCKIHWQQQQQQLGGFNYKRENDQ